MNKNIKKIGIVGGGQLGMMLCDSARKLGFESIIYTPQKSEKQPAEHSADDVIFGDYEDFGKLEEFASIVDVITFEFENIPAKTIEFLEGKKPVMPSSRVIHIIQNRLREKNFLKDNNISTTPFDEIASLEDLEKAVENSLGTKKFILKSANFGYDGKGQVRFERGDDLADVFDKMNSSLSILEQFIEFEQEISVIIAKNKAGDHQFFPIGQNIHKSGILKTSIVPANIDESVIAQAQSIALKLADFLDYIGVLAVEFFVTKDSQLIVNEMAPRVHNSGHWSMNGCTISQFEQHIRAISGLQLISPELTASKVEMTNLLGDEIEDLSKFQNDNFTIYNYNKATVKHGRKMGHVNKVEG